MEHNEIQQQFAAPLLLTPEGYAKLQGELDHLMTVKRPEIAERLRDSKQHGEFSEDNSELDEVKFEQAIVENRIGELKSIFAEAQVLDVNDVDTDFASVGAWITVADKDRGIQFDVRMVSSVEANPDEDLISNESPMGMALYGRKVGDDVVFDAPSGKLKYRIEKIRK
ncbi:MAG: transcription elongation factor GreA [Chthonomonas sp.]|nr:transcription elongation factor GreA [Chthonomonas sp.]